MGTIQKINWKNPFAVLAVFVGVAGVLFLAWTALQQWHDDPPHPVTVTITPEQIDSINAPILKAVAVYFGRQEAANQKELRAALAEDRRADSSYLFFLETQHARDEKYNRALGASDSQLYRIWANRYDR